MDIASKTEYLKRSQQTNSECVIECDSFDRNKYFLNKISGASLPPETDSGEYFGNASHLFVRSLKNIDHPYLFIISSSKEKPGIEIIFGDYRRDCGSASKLGSFYKNAEYLPFSPSTAEGKKFIHNLITGVPVTEGTIGKIDSFIKAVQGNDVVLNICFSPLPSEKIREIKSRLQFEKKKNSENIKTVKALMESSAKGDSLQKGKSKNNGLNISAVVAGKNNSETTSENETRSDTFTESDTVTKEEIDSAAEEYDLLLETHLERFAEAESEGLWQVFILVSATEESYLELASDMFISLFCSSSAEPFLKKRVKGTFNPFLRIKNKPTHGSHPIYDDSPEYTNILTSSELSLLIRLPEEDHNGYEITHIPSFSKKELKFNEGIYLGNILDGNTLTDIDFSIDHEIIKKHILISGITGSGKTSTVFTILKKVNRPFLVIEPAKSEYRALGNAIKDLKIYTLGKENLSPFRFNPFKFGRSTDVQHHIDNLKVIFNASFTMYASMPNILEQCLNNIYKKKGWSFITSENIYYSGEEIPDECYPTLEDLYYEIDDYIKELGYAAEQTQNIRAALLTRIKSLLTGGKGFMLNTTESIDMQELLSSPAVLELEGIADDEEKALITGIILVNVYEYLKSTVTGYNNALKHLIVIEEAHRLFTNVSTQQNQEIANIRGKAVENLSNILCEVRAYGEGILVVDQIPAKLSPDIIKNTNTKIAHRLVSKDDSQCISNSLSITEDEGTYLNKLKTGNALIYSAEMEKPALLKIHSEKDMLMHLSDDELRKLSVEYNSFLRNRNEIHPITELMIQNENSKGMLLKIIQDFYEKIKTEKTSSLHQNYSTAQKEFLNAAKVNGYRVEDDSGRYLRSVFNESVKIFVNTSDELMNDLRKKVYLMRFMKAALYAGRKNYDKNLKMCKQLEINRQIFIRGDI
jgi:DNA helicase HerA-like ATPase